MLGQKFPFTCMEFACYILYNNDHLTCLVGMQSQVAPGLYPPGGFGGVQGMK